MNTQIINTSKTVAAIIVSVALLGGIAEAEIVSHSKNIVIELPTDLPELAQHRGIALQLYSGNEDGKTIFISSNMRCNAWWCSTLPTPCI